MMEFDNEYVIPAVGLYLVMMFIFVVLPGKVGVAAYPTSTLVILGVLLLPISYLVVQRMAQR